MTKPPFQIGPDGELPDHIANQLDDDLPPAGTYDTAASAKRGKNPPISRSATLLTLFIVCGVPLLVAALLSLAERAAPDPRAALVSLPILTLTPPPDTGWLAQQPTCLDQPPPEGSFIVIEINPPENDSELVRAALHADRLTDYCRLTDNTQDDRAPTIAPDGRWIVYVRASSSASVERPGLRLMALDGSADRSLDFPATSVDWSPDGTRLTFAAPLVRAAELYVSQITLGEIPALERITNLTNDDPRSEYNDFAPAWSPDGRQIVLISDRHASTRGGNTLDLYTVDVATGTLRHLLTTPDSLELSAAWSPDGSVIAYTALGAGEVTAQLWLVQPDGTAPRPLTADQLMTYTPVWSPDSTALYYVAAAGYSNGAIYKLDRATNTIKPLTDILDARQIDIWFAPADQ